MRRKLPAVPVDELRPWVDGVDFPAGRLDLLAAALRRTAPDWVVERLGRLPDRRFDDLDEVCRPQHHP